MEQKITENHLFFLFLQFEKRARAIYEIVYRDGGKIYINIIEGDLYRLV